MMSAPAEMGSTSPPGADSPPLERASVAKDGAYFMRVLKETIEELEQEAVSFENLEGAPEEGIL
jgi:hypothetical protein